MSRGTALGRLWYGSKNPESPMIARLGTVGRLGEVCMGAPENLNPNLNLTRTLNLTHYAGCPRNGIFLADRHHWTPLDTIRHH